MAVTNGSETRSVTLSGFRPSRSPGVPTFSARNSASAFSSSLTARRAYLVVGADGIVSLPASHIQQIIRSADERARKEELIFDALRNGATTINLYGLDPTGWKANDTDHRNQHAQPDRTSPVSQDGDSCLGRGRRRRPM